MHGSRTKTKTYYFQFVNLSSCSHLRSAGALPAALQICISSLSVQKKGSNPAVKQFLVIYGCVVAGQCDELLLFLVTAEYKTLCPGGEGFRPNPITVILEGQICLCTHRQHTRGGTET